MTNQARMPQIYTVQVVRSNLVQDIVEDKLDAGERCFAVALRRT